MSRTNAHVPLQVRIARGDTHRRALHDHTNGVCDLPAPLAPDALVNRAGHCHWEWRDDGVGLCPCEMCHLGAQNRRERRRDRQRTRRELKAEATRGTERNAV